MTVQIPRVSRELEVTYKDVQQLQHEISTGFNEAENVRCLFTVVQVVIIIFTSCFLRENNSLSGIVGSKENYSINGLVGKT